MQEEFEDTKRIIRIRKSKKIRQHNGQKKKDKRTNNDRHNIHIEPDLFTTTVSPYLLRFFTVNYALRLNLTIITLEQTSFFQNSFVQKGTYRD